MCTDLSPLESTTAAVAIAGSVAGGVVTGSVVAGSMVDGSMVDRGMVHGSVVRLVVDGSVVGLVVDVLGAFQGHISNHSQMMLERDQLFRPLTGYVIYLEMY